MEIGKYIYIYLQAAEQDVEQCESNARKQSNKTVSFSIRLKLQGSAATKLPCSSDM